eukprot:4065220-Prymnesium_polylepis.1
MDPIVPDPRDIDYRYYSQTPRTHTTYWRALLALRCHALVRGGSDATSSARLYRALVARARSSGSTLGSPRRTRYSQGTGLNIKVSSDWPVLASSRRGPALGGP